MVARIPSVTFDQFRAAIVNEIASLVGLAKIDQRLVTIDGVRGVRLSYPFRITVGQTYSVYRDGKRINRYRASRRRSGYIGLQAHGGAQDVVAFRAIRIREL